MMLLSMYMCMLYIHGRRMRKRAHTPARNSRAIRTHSYDPMNRGHIKIHNLGMLGCCGEQPMDDSHGLDR